jgi:hypothetical protein
MARRCFTNFGKQEARSIGYQLQFLGGEKGQRILVSALYCCIATAALRLTFRQGACIRGSSPFIIHRMALLGFLKNMTCIWVFLVKGLMKSERNKSKRKKRVDNWIITGWVGVERL